MDGYGIQLEIFIDSKHCCGLDVESIGYRHLALNVDNIEKTLRELEIDFDSVEEIKEDWLGIRYCNIVDPDGIVIELHE